MNATWHWCCCNPPGVPRVAFMRYYGSGWGNITTVLNYLEAEGSIQFMPDIITPYSADSLAHVDVVIHFQAGNGLPGGSVMPAEEAAALYTWLTSKVERRLCLIEGGVYSDNMLQQLQRELRFATTTASPQLLLYQNHYLTDHAVGKVAANLTHDSFTYDYVQRLSPYRSDYVVKETTKGYCQILENDYGEYIDGVWGVTGGSVICDATGYGQLWWRARKYVMNEERSTETANALEYCRRVCTRWNPSRVA